jgi:protein dithiol oxidoreductase (disulfide-forming)
METATMHPMRNLSGALSFLAAAFVVALALPAAAQAPQAAQEGREYVRLKSPIPVETGKKIEVIEFFSYGCPHCGDFEPILQNWLKTLPPDVQFRRVPVTFQDRWVALAKEYYTLDALGEDMRLSPQMFAAIHGGNAAMWNEKTFFDWAASKGVDRKKVEEMYNSFGIGGKLNRGRQIAKDYAVQVVPIVVVDGKFLIQANERVPTHAAMIPAIDAAIAKARAERPKS